MHNKIIEGAARITQIDAKKIASVADLISGGSTIAFIARYRKEVTGSLDEVQILDVAQAIEKCEALEKRKSIILETLKETDTLTKELESQIMLADSLTLLEDIYLPFRPKKKTRASMARAKGLEPLADIIFAQKNSIIPSQEAEKFLDPEKMVETVEQALEGAKDIIAEKIAENTGIRKAIRNLFTDQSILQTKLVKGMEVKGEKFKDYFDFSQQALKAPGHRILAAFRGHSFGFLSLSLQPDSEDAIRLIKSKILKNSPAAELMAQTIEDSYKRLIKPSMETEAKKSIKLSADIEAIEVFSSNLTNLLMAPPFGRKRILAIDPGHRTGCKVALLDEKADLLDYFVLFPFDDNKKEHSKKSILQSVKKHSIQAIAVGNGTAGRETLDFIKQIDPGIPSSLVDESGASIYSASKVAREEFPDLDLTFRSAVSIGRRLMDPLAELVKIDPKSIGVGQYQHDVDQKLLRSRLDTQVVSCVNNVGVELNLASRELLSYVSGLGPKTAQAIVNYRQEKGAFKSRTELKKVPGLGPKSFEQCAGFLKISGSTNPLDNSSVHPESYGIVNQMAKDCSSKVKDLIDNPELIDKIQIENYISDKVGLPTLTDIINELKKPGRDPRPVFEIFSFTDGVNRIEDLKEGMRLPGIVTNVTKFGAFVDLGVHQDGLVHISQMANAFVKDPADIVSVKQKVNVKILSVDIQRKRISLSLKN